MSQPVALVTGVTGQDGAHPVEFLLKGILQAIFLKNNSRVSLAPNLKLSLAGTLIKHCTLSAGDRTCCRAAPVINTLGTSETESHL